MRRKKWNTRKITNQIHEGNPGERLTKAKELMNGDSRSGHWVRIVHVSAAAGLTQTPVS